VSEDPDVTRRSADKAFTLAELLMAVSITSIIALAVAAMATALGHAQSSTDSMREAIQSARIGVLRMGDTLRTSKLVTCASSDRLIAWTGDANDNDEINLSELVMFRYQPDDDTIEQWQILFPDSMPAPQRAVLDITRTLSQAVNGSGIENTMSRATYASYLVRPVLASSVNSFTMEASPGVPETAVVRLRVNVGEGVQQITLNNTAGLRADATEYVEQSQGAWVLNLP